MLAFNKKAVCYLAFFPWRCFHWASTSISFFMLYKLQKNRYVRLNDLFPIFFLWFAFSELFHFKQNMKQARWLNTKLKRDFAQMSLLFFVARSSALVQIKLILFVAVIVYSVWNVFCRHQFQSMSAIKKTWFSLRCGKKRLESIFQRRRCIFVYFLKLEKQFLLLKHISKQGTFLCAVQLHFRHWNLTSIFHVEWMWLLAFVVRLRSNHCPLVHSSSLSMVFLPFLSAQFMSLTVSYCLLCGFLSNIIRVFHLRRSN